MKRRAARTTFSTAQLALWDELQTAAPQPPAQAVAPAVSASHPSAPAPAQPPHASHGGRG